jgi:hypothetical protein
MSTPQTASGSQPVEKDKSKRRSIQRYLSKIIKTGKQGKKTDLSQNPESSSSTAPALATTSEVPAVIPPVAEASKTTDNAASEPKVVPVATEVVAKQTTISIGARQLAEKHGIDIPEDWPYATRPPAGERVEKAIRMRVRRYCHQCQTAFGSEKTCPSCSHKRCVDCPRSPAAKTDKKKTKTKHKEYDPYENLTMPSKTGGQDLVYRKIRQRVHYKCHKCETDFAGQKACGQCSHNRCKKCHREPSKKPKPVEEPKRKRTRKWTCSECSTPSNITRHCTQCNHVKCVKCVPELPKRKKPVRGEGYASETDTQDQGVSQSTIDKVTSALAATGIA